jgi:hypothetical protein
LEKESVDGELENFFGRCELLKFRLAKLLLKRGIPIMVCGESGKLTP